MRIEIRADSVVIEGYVNAVARDSRPMRDRKTGKRFVEQIVPGVFERALRHNEVQLLLNHDKSRNLGSTSTNLELYEDSIGLHARAEVTDPEVIEKARKKKLRGWSFGFRERDASTEDIHDALERRYVEDMDLVEANEAFAAQSVAVARDLDFDMSKVNVNGGAIALGHPVGCSGCRILVTLLYEMEKRDAKKGLATLCVGGGMGCAAIVERE